MCTRPTQLINVAECVGGASENISPSIECGGKQLNILMVGSDCYKIKFRAATIQHHHRQKPCSFHFFLFLSLRRCLSVCFLFLLHYGILASLLLFLSALFRFLSSFSTSFAFGMPPSPIFFSFARLSVSVFVLLFAYFSSTLAFHPLFFRLFPPSLPSEHLLLRLFPLLFSIPFPSIVSSIFPPLSPSVLYCLLFPFFSIISSPFILSFMSFLQSFILFSFLPFILSPLLSYPFLPCLSFIPSARLFVLHFSHNAFFLSSFIVFSSFLSFLLSSLLFPFSHALPSVLYFLLFPFLSTIPSPFSFLSDPSFYSSIPVSSSRSCLSFPHSLSKLILVLTSNSFGLPTFPSVVHHVVKYFL